MDPDGWNDRRWSGDSDTSRSSGIHGDSLRQGSASGGHHRRCVREYCNIPIFLVFFHHEMTPLLLFFGGKAAFSSCMFGETQVSTTVTDMCTRHPCPTQRLRLGHRSRTFSRGTEHAFLCDKLFFSPVRNMYSQ
jgi:hypothetical protein